MSQRQENAIHEFIRELSSLEEKFEDSGAAVIAEWLPLLHECSMIAPSVLNKKTKEEWQKNRLKSDLHSARRAAIILPSEASRVFDILMLIGDFMLCVIAVLNEAKAIIDAIDSDNEARLSELKNIARNQKINMSDTLDLVTKYMKGAETEEQVIKYRNKCFEKLKSVEEGEFKCNANMFQRRVLFTLPE